MNFSNKASTAKRNSNNFTIFTVTSPLVFPKQKRREIYKKKKKNFAIFTVTVPLVLLIGTKDSEKFTENFAIFTVTVPLVLPKGKKAPEKFRKFCNVHSFSSTNPSHRHEGVDNGKCSGICQTSQ